jgi:hypothetical protein
VVPDVRHSSGLWLPPGYTDGTRQQRIARPSPELPAELRPPLPDLLLPMSAMPTADEMIFCAPSLEYLGFPSATLGDILELVSDLPFAPAMLTLSVLSAELHHHPRDRARHLRLASDLYTGVVWDGVRGFVEASPSHVGFDLRHVTTLQRLLVRHAAPDRSRHDALDFASAMRLGGALLAISSALPHGDPSPHDPATPADWAAWARFTTLIGAWHDAPDIGEAVARAHALYADVHAGVAREARGWCDIDAWMIETYGLTMTEQLAGALACAAVVRALDRDADPGERFMHVEPGFLRDGAFKDKEDAIVRLLSATREELAELTADGDDDAARLAWDHTAFEQRPFLRAPDGTLRLISPRALVSWMTRGMHYRALRAAEERSHPRKSGRSMSTIYLSYAGDLGEEAVRRLVAGSLRMQERLGIVRLHGEHDYRIGKRRLSSPDLLLDYGEDLVISEVFSGRISRDARTSLDAELLRKALDKGTTVKLSELAARTRELLAGELTYNGVDLARVRRIWPVVVLVGDPILQTPALWHYLRHAVPEAFIDDARVQLPFILDLDDLEPLLALVEGDGHTLPGLLADLAVSPYAELPPRNWVHSTFGGIPCRPRYVEEQLRAAMRLAGTALFPGSERLAEWTPIGTGGLRPNRSMTRRATTWRLDGLFHGSVRRSRR